MQKFYKNARIFKTLLIVVCWTQLQGVWMQCRDSEWSCNDGSCISKMEQCDGIYDCDDGSDEAAEICIYTAPTPTNRISETDCQIPKYREDLRFRLHPSNSTVLPGSWLKDGDTINVECGNEARARNASVLLCDAGIFNGDFPQCFNECDATTLIGLSTKYECFSHSNQKILPHFCTNGVLTGTKIKITCKSGFKREVDTKDQTLRCLPTGYFDQEREPCIENCGQLSSSFSVLKSGGSTLNQTGAAWHVVIYEKINGKFVNICAGSIIAPSIVISAAHCFWDGQQMKLPYLFRFVAGKYNTGNEVPQMSSAENIYASSNFLGKRNSYRADMAIIKLESPFVFTEHISSICWLKNISEPTNFMQSNIKGMVTRYGPNKSFEKIDMITRDYHTCKNTTDGIALTDDKFCVYNNDGASLCRGDSGSGFVELLYGSYNLMGIISYAPSATNNCSLDGVVAVANVRYIEDDLSDILVEEMRKGIQRY